MNDDWLKGYKLPAGTVMPAKIRRRRRQFIMVPWAWMERLVGASGQTYRVALWLVYQHWKSGGGEIKVANGMLEIDGISRQSKWRSLTDLERRGLIAVKRRRGKSPLIELFQI